MSEARLPRMIRSLGDELKLYPVYLNRGSDGIEIGGKHIPFDSPYIEQETVFPSGESVSGSDVLQHPLLIGVFGNPMGTPKLYDYIRSERSKGSDFMSTREAILDVFETVHNVKIGEKASAGDGVFGISVDFIRATHPHIRLVTIGNCACLDVEYDGHMVDEDDWDDKFMEFGYHNTDWPAQRISLLAGMGHLASLSAKSK